jgi:hypothetical protein
MVAAAAFSPWRRRLARAVVALCCLLPALPSQAQRPADDPLYTVSNVPVDASAPDPLQARDKALLEGEKRAFDVLLRRLIPEAEIAKLTPPSQPELEAMVKGFEFAEERTAPGRYSALLSVVFRADRIGAYLRGASVPFVESSAPPILAIPVLRSRTGVAPLDEKSAWREAWTRVSRTGGVVPMPVLRADAADLQAIDGEQAFVGDIEALRRVAERYKARRVLVSVASGEGVGPFALSATVFDVASGEKYPLPGQNNVAADKLADAALALRTRLDEDWKSVAALSRDVSDTIVAIVPLKDLAEWVRIRRRISGAVPVRNVEVQALEESRAIVSVSYIGTRAQLDKALERMGLTIVEAAGTLSIVPR